MFSLESPHRGDSNKKTQYTNLQLWDFFLGTEERVRNSRGKRAISVRAIEVLLYLNRNFLDNTKPLKLALKSVYTLEFAAPLLWERVKSLLKRSTVKILKIGTPEIITIIVLQLEQLDFTVQYCVQKMQTE